MAIANSTTNPSARRTIQIALPLRAFLAYSPLSEPPIEPGALLRTIVTNAGVLPDATPDGFHVVLLALPPQLLEALAAYVPPAPQPMPLLEWRACA